MDIYKKNLYMELIVAAFFAITAFFFGPLEILLSQSGEFWFSVADVLPIIITSTLSVFGALMVAMLVASVIGKKALNIVIALISGIGLCLYLQGNWTFVNYGNMDGTPIDWNAYKTWGRIDTFIWILVILVLLLAIVLSEKTHIIFRYLFLGIIGIEVVTLGTLAINSIGTDGKAQFTLYGEGDFCLSKDNKNILVVVADGFDAVDLLPVFQEEPDLKEFFDGFTFYEDVCGTSLYSEESGITLLTGNQFEVGPSFKDNVKKAYQETNLYDLLKNNNYATYLYCEEKMVSPDIIDYVENASMSRTNVGDRGRAFKSIYKMVAFRYMPHALKHKFWYSTMDFSEFKDGNVRLYYNYDVYGFLEENGVRIDENNRNVYQFYWIHGPHEPANTDRYCHKVDNIVEKSNPLYVESQFEQTIGVVRLFTKIIEEMKKAGVYDNTTIIFTADHGWDIRPNPLFIVKPENAHGKLNISEAPLSMIEDYLPTLEYFITGENRADTIYGVPEGAERSRKLYVYDWNSDRTYNSREEVYYESGAFSSNIELGEVLGADDIAWRAIKGFSASEGTHIWTNGYNAELSVKIADTFNNLKMDMQYVTYHGKQPVLVYVNDVLIAKYIADGEETKSLIIPDDYIKTEELNLRFELPNAVAPSEVDDHSTDDRILALAFQTIRFEDSNEEMRESQIEKFEYYNLGTELKFSEKNDTAYDYVVTGLSYPESIGAWTNSNEVEMLFELEDYVDGDIDLNVNHIAFNEQQRVVVSVNDNEIQSYIASGEQNLTFIVPAEIIKKGVIALRFELPDAISPEQIGQSRDDRILALYFKGLSFKKHETSE